jgi:YYY domain-containing protein
MLQALATLLTVELIGLAAFPFVARAFPVLADRGWAISKPVGMLLVATAVWLVSYSRLIPNTPFTWWAILVLLAVGSAWVLRSDWRRLRKTLIRRWRIIVTLELIFLVFFLMFLSLRAFDPAASGTEKPMDLMMLTAVTSAEYAPPDDLWLAGEPIAYYYFGYWMYGGVNAMVGTGPAVAFNVGIALVAGMAASIAAALVITLIRRDGASTKIALMAGAASSFLLLLVSNLSGLWTLLDITRLAPNWLLNWYGGGDYDRVGRIATWRPDDFWWWWKSSRIINTIGESGNELDVTIQEYPFFSLLLGDFHPHLMSIPFLLTGITVLTALFIAHRSVSFGALRRNIPATVIAAVVIGSSGFINFWDVGLLLMLSTGLVIAGWVLTRQGGFISLAGAALPLGALWVAGILIYAPFYFGTAESQVQWPPIAPVMYGSRPIHFISVWLLLMIVVAPLAVVLASRYANGVIAQLRGQAIASGPERQLIWRPAWITGLALVVVPWVAWAATHLAFNDNARVSDVISRLPVTGLLGLVSVVLIAVTLTRARRGADDGAHYVMLLGALALYLLFAAELFFVHDLFGNRMNTVFKFYYQAWILLSVAGGYGIYVWWRHHPALSGRSMWVSRTGITVLAVVAISSFYFPVASAVSKTIDSGLGPNLDSLSFLESRDQEEKDVIERIREMAGAEDVLVEAVAEFGGSYTDYGRIAGSTGVPTILGWLGHERQWHGTDEFFADRQGDVETIYTTDDESELRRLIDKYSLTMVVVGPREISTYGNIDMTMFDTLGDRIIEHGEFTVFSINR